MYIERLHVFRRYLARPKLGSSNMQIHKNRTLPIAKYLRENVEALDVMLSADDLERIDEVAPKDVAAGSRYPEAMMKLLGK